MAATPVEFQSAFGLTESVDRLKAATRRSVFGALTREAAVGKVSARRVVLQRVIPMIGNSFKPFFVGRFVERGGRVFLVGSFGMSWLVRAFMTIWFGAIGLFELFAAATVPAAPRGHGLFLLMPLGMAAAGAALIAVGKWLSRNDPAWISRVIAGALSAQRMSAVPDRSDDQTRTRIIGAISLMLAVVALVPVFVPGAANFPGSPVPASRLLLTLQAVSSALLLFISYGAFRRELFAWRLGFVFWGLVWVEVALESLRPQPDLRPPPWAEAAILLASFVVTAIWGCWWYGQRRYWVAAEGGAGQPPRPLP